MQPGLNFDKEDEKFILLGKVYEFIESDLAKDIINRSGFRQRGKAVDCIKIFFMSVFFNYDVSRVIDELKNKEKLRKFARILDVPTEYQVSEYFSRYSVLNFFNMANYLLASFFKPHKTIQDEYIVDGTPVECDINVIKQFIRDSQLKKLGLKWGYSRTKKYFIGYKVTVVLEKSTLTPVALFIHPGVPNDAKIFDIILKELKRRHIIKHKDVLYFDRGYYSHTNYQIGINKYKILPIIFPKSSYDINKIKDQLSFPLTIYNNLSKIDKCKNEITLLAQDLVEILKEWEELKPERGIIEDFFKVAKDAFGLGKFHSYTDKSMTKNIVLTLLLTTIVIQTGFKTKTQLQRLSEGYIDFEPPKTNKKKNTKEDNSNNEKYQTQHKNKQVTLDVSYKKKYSNLDAYTII